MEVMEAIRGRRSVRRFLDRGVDDELLMELLDAARWAPSAGNLQPWEFVVVRDPELKKDLARAALSQMFIAQAPAVIVVCADALRSASIYGTRGSTLYCIQDTAAATQNMLLAAYSRGLGTCWVGAFREDAVGRLIDAPAGVRPVAIVPVGYPAEKPKPPPRRSLSEIVHHETF